MMKMRWHCCEGGKNLPPAYKSKVCLFMRAGQFYLDICVLVEDLSQDDLLFWVLKGGTDRNPVYPIAWLEMDIQDFTIKDLENLRLLETVEV